MRTLLSPDEAAALLLQQAQCPAVEEVALADAFGRILSAELTATLPLPHFDRSPFDGYAVRAADTAAAAAATPVVLEVVEEIPAGHQPQKALQPGQAAKILTGAPLPAGADTVIKYEETVFTASSVQISRPLTAGRDVVRVGEALQEGAPLAASGTRLCAPLVALLASQGLARLPVYRRPVAVILSTGSELAPAGTPLAPAQIYETNRWSVGGFLRGLGFQVIDGGIVADDVTRIAQELRAALPQADLVVTTGGASVGDYDFALQAAEQAGAETLFWKVQLKPGGAMTAALADGKLVLGLSGNPGAALIGLFRVAGPCLRRLTGRRKTAARSLRVRLRAPWNKPCGSIRLLRGHLEVEEGTACFVPHEGTGNAVISSFVHCDLLAELPAGTPPLPAGTMVQAWAVDWDGEE